MATPKQEYAAALRDIAGRYGSMEADTIGRSIQLLRDMRERLQVQLTTAQTFDAARLQQMTRAVDDLVASYEAQLVALSRAGLTNAAHLGALSVTEPLAAAGVSFGFFQPTPAQLNVLLDFSADLIRDIGRQTRQAINTEIRLAALGERSTIDAMKRITAKLGLKAGKQVVGGVAIRGETILRTEMGRVFNLSNFSQMLVTGRSVPGLKKQWLATGDRRTRLSHLKAHVSTKKEPVPFNQPFVLISGAKLMFPLDPAGPANETINCRCRMAVIHPEIGVIGGPEDARVKKEQQRRGIPTDRVPTFTSWESGTKWVANNLPLGNPPSEEFPTDPKVTEGSLSVWSYTGSTHGAINRNLRDGTLGQYESLSQAADVLDRSLQKLPRFEGVVYRGLRFDSKEERSQFMLNLLHASDRGPVVFPAFTSSSIDQKEAHGFAGHARGVMMTIESKSGRILGRYSRYPDREREVLFNRDSIFRLKSFSQDELGQIHIFLEEIP